MMSPPKIGTASTVPNIITIRSVEMIITTKVMILSKTEKLCNMGGLFITEGLLLILRENTFFSNSNQIKSAQNY
jgi:hypothetical protein